MITSGKGHVDEWKKGHIKKGGEAHKLIIKMLKYKERITLKSLRTKNEHKGYLQVCLTLEKGEEKEHSLGLEEGNVISCFY